MKPIKNRITCNNGMSLSIQASAVHYSTPRNDEGPYTHVEVGFIEGATPPESWKKYGDGAFPSDVYGYIPLELVLSFIKENGGSTEPLNL